MRTLLVSALLLIPASASADVRAVAAPAVEKPRQFADNSQCLNATRQFAHKGSAYRGDPARPRKLVELPPAETYAAVYRLENGCAVPVLYREVRSGR